MRKNWKRLILNIFFCLIIIILFIYIKQNKLNNNQENGKAVLKIASWSFLVNKEEKIVKNINLVNEYNQENLQSNYIAPGTEGAFNVVIDATASNVGIDYYIFFENETEKPQNLQFIYDNHIVKNLKELEEYLKGTIKNNDVVRTKNIEILWKWPFESGETEDEIDKQDIIDTKDAKLIDNYQFDVIVKGKQAEPIQT